MDADLPVNKTENQGNPCYQRDLMMVIMMMMIMMMMMKILSLLPARGYLLRDPEARKRKKTRLVHSFPVCLSANVLSVSLFIV